MKKIIIGLCGTGKSVAVIAPAIKKHKGRVIWVTATDERKYLEIDDVFTLEENPDTERVLVIVGTERMDRHTASVIKNYILTYADSDETLFIFDEGIIATDGVLNDILRKQNINCIIAFQAFSQIKSLLDQKYADEDIDILLTHVQNWDIICSSDFHALFADGNITI